VGGYRPPLNFVFGLQNIISCDTSFDAAITSPPGWLQPAGLCYASVTSFIIVIFFFNDRLEQRDLRNYKTDLHQIFRDGRHVGVDVQSGIDFVIGQGTSPWQPIFKREIGRNRRHAFMGFAFHNGWQDGKSDGRINSAEVLSTSYKN